MGTAEDGGFFTAKKHALQARPFLYGRVRFTRLSLAGQSSQIGQPAESTRAFEPSVTIGAPSNHQSTRPEQHGQHGGYLDGVGSDGENSPGL